MLLQMLEHWLLLQIIKILRMYFYTDNPRAITIEIKPLQHSHFMALDIHAQKVDGNGLKPIGQSQIRGENLIQGVNRYFLLNEFAAEPTSTVGSKSWFEARH